MSTATTPSALAHTAQQRIVSELRSVVTNLEFPLELAGVADARRRRNELLTSLTDHVEPRLTEAARPLLVVVAGSTGAGKSTIVNSLLGAELSPASVLRPTTRRPVLLHHPDDGPHPVGDRVLTEVEMHATDAVPKGLVLLDAPDIDSVVAANRDRAMLVLQAADLWLFVTTPTRYGDAVPWQVLRQAAQRQVAIAVVLNRVSPGELRTVRLDLAARLRQNDLGSAPLFSISDAGAHEGLLPADTVAQLRRWLESLANGTHARMVARRSLAGALADLHRPVGELITAFDQQVTHLAALIDRLGAQGEATEAAGDPLLSDAQLSQAVRDAWQTTVRGSGVLDETFKEGRLRGARARRTELRTALGALGTAILDAAAAHLQRVHNEVLATATGVVSDELPDFAWQLTDADDATWLRNWRQSAVQAVSGWLASGDEPRRRKAMVRSVGESGVADLLVSAALGLPEASAILQRGGGETAAAPAAALREALAQRSKTARSAAIKAAQHDLAQVIPDVDGGAKLRELLAQLEETR